MKMEQTERSETSAYKIQTPGNYLEKSAQHSEHGESLQSGKHLHDFHGVWNVLPSCRENIGHPKNRNASC